MPSQSYLKYAKIKSMKSQILTKKELQKAVATSSKIEGMSFYRAKKNTKVIKLLEKHGRAFSL